LDECRKLLVVQFREVFFLFHKDQCVLPGVLAGLRSRKNSEGAAAARRRSAETGGGASRGRLLPQRVGHL
jgi:hypothetical protein